MRLIAADDASLRASLAPDGVQPCPEAPQRRRIVVEVLGEDRCGVADIAVRLDNGAGAVLLAKTGPDGRCRFDGLDPGSYGLALPGLDRDAWQLVSTAALQGAAALSTGSAPWQPAAPAQLDAPFIHHIVEGECISMLAARYGFFPPTLWEHEANQGLRAIRDSLYVLVAGDAVTIPPRRPHAIEAAAGSHVVVKRKGVPERLRICFTNYKGRPRSGLPYLLSVATASGDAAPVVSATTDAHGCVDAFIPPDAVSADITFGYGAERELHRFSLGKLQPADCVSGWQGRLANLGFYRGECNGMPDALLHDAIAAFQDSRGLPVTGAMDAATQQALHDAARS